MQDTASELLREVSRKGNVEDINTALKAKADIEYNEGGHGTPLILATAYAHPDAVSFLIKSHADLKALDRNGHTALHVAVVCDNAMSDKMPSIIQILLEAGCDIDIPISESRDNIGNAGNTALHLAAARGYRNFVDILLKRGANHKAYNRQGLTPVTLAINSKQIDIATHITNYHNSFKNKLLSLKAKDYRELEDRVGELNEKLTLKNSLLENTQLELAQLKVRKNTSVSSVAEKANFVFISAFIGTTLFCVWLTLKGDKAFNGSTESKAAIVGIACGALFITYCFYEYKNAKAQFGRFFNEVTETVRKLGYTFEDVGKATERLINSTDDFIVTLREESKQTLTEYRGIGKEIAKAINEGIRQKKFGANVKVNVEHVNINVHNKAVAGQIKNPNCNIM